MGVPGTLEIDIVIARQVSLGNAYQAHHDLVPVVQRQIIEGDVSYGETEIHTIGIADQRIDQFLWQHVLAMFVTSLCVSEPVGHEFSAGIRQWQQTEVKPRRQRTGWLNDGAGPCHRGAGNDVRRALRIVSVEKLRNVVGIQLDAKSCWFGNKQDLGFVNRQLVVTTSQPLLMLTPPIPASVASWRVFRLLSTYTVPRTVSAACGSKLQFVRAS